MFVVIFKSLAATIIVSIVLTIVLRKIARYLR